MIRIKMILAKKEFRLSKTELIYSISWNYFKEMNADSDCGWSWHFGSFYLFGDTGIGVLWLVCIAW